LGGKTTWAGATPAARAATTAIAKALRMRLVVHVSWAAGMVKVGPSHWAGLVAGATAAAA